MLLYATEKGSYEYESHVFENISSRDATDEINRMYLEVL
jgi:hypothetical protein